MAVPKKRRSKQSTRRHKTAWYKKAYQTGALSFALALKQRKQSVKESFKGFGQK